MIRRVTLLAGFVLLLAPAAVAQPNLTATASAGPSETITWDVSGAAANARILVLGSFRNDGMSLGPFQSRCGAVRLDLAIGPGHRFVGVGRTQPDGTFTRSVTLPGKLPPRLNGATIYSQAVTVEFTDPPRTQDCTLTVTTSNVTTTTVHVP